MVNLEITSDSSDNKVKFSWKYKDNNGYIKAITQYGKGIGVLRDIAKYKKMQEQMELLQNIQIY